MTSHSSRVLVLRKTKLGETDAIVTMLAEDGCQTRAVAKGMRKPGSRLSGALELFTEADLLLHNGRNLDIVREAQVIDAHAALRKDFDRLSAASVVTDVLDKISVEGQAEERLFGLAQATLLAMEDSKRLTLVVCAFLVKAMAMHGYRPELESCAVCASEITGGRLFSMSSGGVLCSGCGGDEPSTITLSEEGRTLILTLLRARMAEVDAIECDPGTVSKTFSLLHDFVRYHVPARMKALDMYAEMSLSVETG